VNREIASEKHSKALEQKTFKKALALLSLSIKELK